MGFGWIQLPIEQQWLKIQGYKVGCSSQVKTERYQSPSDCLACMAWQNCLLLMPRIAKKIEILERLCRKIAPSLVWEHQELPMPQMVPNYQPTQHQDGGGLRCDEEKSKKELEGRKGGEDTHKKPLGTGCAQWGPRSSGGF